MADPKLRLTRLVAAVSDIVVESFPVFLVGP